MKQSILIFAIIALITSCKSSASVAPIILKDSVSITYKQGQEQPSPSGLRGAQTDFRKNSCVPADGSVGVGGATQGASVFEEVLSERTNKPAVPPTPIIRVDTVFIERWHTQTIREPTSLPYEGKVGKGSGATKFYKDCTKGFWILLIVLLGSFGFRILKAIYLKR